MWRGLKAPIGAHQSLDNLENFSTSSLSTVFLLLALSFRFVENVEKLERRIRIGFPKSLPEDSEPRNLEAKGGGRGEGELMKKGAFKIEFILVCFKLEGEIEVEPLLAARGQKIAGDAFDILFAKAEG